MSTDEIRAALARSYIASASDDWVWVEAGVADARLPASPMGFHAQQAIEKLLKAPLVLAGRPVHKIHDLDLLAAEAEEAWPGLRELVGDAALVTRWGFAYRYPHPGPAFAVRPTPERVSSVIADAERLHAFLTERLARA